MKDTKHHHHQQIDAALGSSARFKIYLQDLGQAAVSAAWQRCSLQLCPEESHCRPPSLGMGPAGCRNWTLLILAGEKRKKRQQHFCVILKTVTWPELTSQACVILTLASCEKLSGEALKRLCRFLLRPEGGLCPPAALGLTRSKYAGSGRSAEPFVILAFAASLSSAKYVYTPSLIEILNVHANAD